MNSIMERWIQACHQEPLDRTPIWNQTHLHALREYERHHTGTVLIGVSRTRDRCSRYPNRLPIPPRSHTCTSADTIASAGSSTNRIMQRELHG